ncbi:hypothetical protein G6F24_003246 [Rhizopus arrhizus]|nr:hypothetical protein G6F24_003246 [Rhizopus arrhizus]
MTAAAATGVGHLAADGKRAVGHALLGDEVDYPADGVGTVQRRGAVAEDLDAVDGGEGNGVEVHRGAVDGVVRQAPAVEQDQRLVRADAAHVGEGRAARGRAHRAGGVGDRLATGDALDDLGRGGHALLAQFVGAQDGHRHRGFGIRPADRRAGDFHAVQLGGGRSHGRRRGFLFGAHRLGVCQ